MTTAANNQQKNNSNEEEKHFCRLCHGTDDDSNTHLAGIDQEWVHPCKCSGSIKWVHRGCFGMWREQASAQQRKQCSICSYSFRFSLRLKPRWFTEMHIFYWILISAFLLNIFMFFYCIATSNYVYIFRYAITLCAFSVLMRILYGLQLQKLELYKLRLENFHMDLQLFADELAELEDGEQVDELDVGPAPVAPTNSSLFEQSGHIQNAE